MTNELFIIQIFFFYELFLLIPHKVGKAKRIEKHAAVSLA